MKLSNAQRDFLRAAAAPGGKNVWNTNSTAKALESRGLIEELLSHGFSITWTVSSIGREVVSSHGIV